MQIRTFVVVALSSALTGVAVGAGASGGGFADVQVERAKIRKVRGGAPDQQRGGALTETDSSGAPGSTSNLPASTVCDFAGFPNRDGVNGAYGGSLSASGVARTNLGVSFSGLQALNAWNGSGSPDPSVAFAPSGSFVMSNSNGSFWRSISFSYSASVALTVQTYSGPNATGTLLQTFTIPANLSGAPFSTWTARQLDLGVAAKSARMSGGANYWGIDAVAMVAGCPGPTSGADDCNGNGQSDACEIAYGLVQDCNGNGRPDSCDIQGQAPLTVGFEQFLGSGGTFLTNEIPGLIFEAGSTGSRWTVVDITGGQTYNTSSWDCENGVDGGYSRGDGNFWVCGKVSVYPSTPYDGQGRIRLAGTGATYFQCRYSSSTPLRLIAYDSSNAQIDLDLQPANTRYANGNSQGPGLLRVDAPANKRIAYVRVTDSGNAWTIDSIETDVLLSSPAPDCNANGIIDTCEIASGSVADCNGNGIPDACDIAAGLATDCNANGKIDQCELASGTAVDQNGNGVPDSCDPFPTMTLTTNAAACNAVGSVVDVEARLSGVLNLVVAGQLVLDWDPTKLELVASNPGDAPYVSSFLVNNSAGQAVILVSADPGSSGTTAPSAIVSRLRFQVLGGSCDASGTSVGFGTFSGLLSTEFTDGFGSSIVPTLIASSGFVVDDGAPVLSNVPADVSVQAYAGENGFALVSLGTPTATDACAPGLTATGVRSDGQALGAAWPSGTTAVTWSAVDPCGNTTTATTRVTVDPTNTMDLAANFVAPFGFNDPYGGGGGAARTLTVSARGTAGSVSRSPTVSVGRDGVARFSINDLPVDAYECVTIEHAPNSLRARVTVSDTGSAWTAQDATLVLGDIINDEVIDVLDWGAYIVRNPNADLNADGFISSTDGDIILANFGRLGDSACGVNSPERAPMTAVSVSDLVGMGMAELAGADLNGDGWLDQADMDLGVR